jgi:hypothetical protein
MNNFKTICGAFLLLTIFAVGMSAQTKKKRTPKPLATPLPTLTGAEIISRAGDYEDPATGQPAQKTPQKSPTATSTKIRDLTDRVDRLESTSKKEDPEAKQRRMLLNLDILTRAETRAEGLRKEIFEMTEKENSIRSRLDQLDIDSRPEMIERTLQLSGGSMHPEDVRDARRKSLDAERANLQTLLAQLQNSKTASELSLSKAEALVEKLRVKLDKEMDNDFLKDDPADHPDQ